MKFITLLISLFFSTQLYSQQQIPDLVIPIQITFQTGNSPVNMEIGLDSMATNCLDPQFGESQLPPPPPPGLDAVLQLPYPECHGSHGEPIYLYKDFRFGEQPYTGARTHKLFFLSQLGVTIHWSLPEGITGILQEPNSGAMIYPMAGQDSFFVPIILNKLNMVINYSIEEPPVQVLSHVTITDGQTLFPRVLYFGLDSTATDSIDAQLGESNLPPFPPPGAFEVRFFLPDNNFLGSLSSYSDFRYATLPYSGQKEWRIAYQTDFGNELNIIWDFPHYLTGVLQDIINGTFINVPMADSGSYTVTDPYIFNRLRMIIDYNIETPVELFSFNATLLGNVVKINWSTATETNNSGFEVERNTPLNPLSRGEAEGRGVWEKIGFISGHGTTTEPKSYSFTDENVKTGNYKYRLKQIDFDGTFTYSNEIEVEVDFTPKEFMLYQNYPNPFNPNTIIKYEIPGQSALGGRNDNVLVTLKVYDVLGNEVVTLVNEEKQSGNYDIEFNGSGLASGVYLYRLTAGSFSTVKKLVLLK